MTVRIIEARDLALEKHRNQRYGVYPYEIHLTNVVTTLLHFGFTFEEDELIMAAWLHDVLEDTNVEKTYISAHFGESVSKIVEAVSNHKDKTKTKSENKRVTFSKISKNEKAIKVKLADRIANVEFSLLHGNVDKLNKYKKEQVLINELIAPVIHSERANKMYVHLKNLLGY